MSSAKITLVGLLHYDKKLFDSLTLPDGIDKDLFIDSLILRCGEFEVLHADAEYNKYMIGVWGRKWYKTFEKWAKALEIDFNPLDNYDRFEEWTDEGDASSGGSSLNKVSAFNSNSLEDNNKLESDTKSASKSVHKGRVRGNIGVTSSSQLLEGALSIYEWSLYDHMTDLFINEFLIGVY